MKKIIDLVFANGHKYEIISSSSMSVGSINLNAFCYKAFKIEQDVARYVTQNLDLNELIANLIAMENAIYRNNKELEEDTYKSSSENMEI